MSVPMEMLEELRSFMKIRVVLTATELGIFDMLDKEPDLKLEQVAERLSSDTRATQRLLDCLVALGYLKKIDERYFLMPSGKYLTSNHPETILPMVLHYVHLWENWSNLTESIIKGTNPKRRSPFSDPRRLEAFIKAMHVIGRDLAQEIASFYHVGDKKKLLDIGGGSGTYTIAFLKRYPQLRAVIFDLPEVIPMAKRRIAYEGLSERVEFVAGDFYQDELPKGSDLALLSAIIHQNSPEENIRLYRAIYEALEEGGKILIRDHVMNEDRTYPPAGTLFALNMLVSTQAGDTYTFMEIKEHLENAGFANVKLLRSGPKMDCLVEAEKRE